MCQSANPIRTSSKRRRDLSDALNGRCDGSGGKRDVVLPAVLHAGASLPIIGACRNSRYGPTRTTRA